MEIEAKSERPNLFNVSVMLRRTDGKEMNGNDWRVINSLIYNLNKKNRHNSVRGLEYTERDRLARGTPEAPVIVRKQDKERGRFMEVDVRLIDPQGFYLSILGLGYVLVDSQVSKAEDLK